LQNRRSILEIKGSFVNHEIWELTFYTGTAATQVRLQSRAGLNVTGPLWHLSMGLYKRPCTVANVFRPLTTAKSQERVVTEWRRSAWFAKRPFVLITMPRPILQLSSRCRCTVSAAFCCSVEVSMYQCRNVLVPKCLGAELSGHFGTAAEVSSGDFGTSAEVLWCRSVLGLKCPVTIQLKAQMLNKMCLDALVMLSAQVRLFEGWYQSCQNSAFFWYIAVS